MKGCKKAHGSWAYTIDAGRDPATGKRRQVVRSGFRTRDEAQEVMTTELAALSAGTWTDDRSMTVGQWLSTWLEESSERRSPKTMANYRGHVRDVWSPRLGHLKLRDLRRVHIENVLRDLGKPATGDRPMGNVGRRVTTRQPRTIDGYRRTIRAALSAAQRRGLILMNPAQGRIDAIPQLVDVERTIWEPEETARFLEHVAGDRLAALFELAAYTGLRRAELCGLRWSDLDADGVGLVVRQTLVEVSSKNLRPGDRVCAVCGVEHKGRFFKAPKSRAGKRWVPLAAPALSAVRAHQIAQSSEREMFGIDYADHDLVFPDAAGNPLRPGNVTLAFERHAKACGLPLIELHAMRHGACSLMLVGGAPIEVVQMVLGHSSPAVTRAVYRHMLKKATAEQIEAATELLTRHRRALSDGRSPL
jgi:integrase